jgi:hypothetical protein
MFKYTDRIEVIILLSIICYLIGLALMMYYGLKTG